MGYEISTQVEAPLEHVWAVLTEVERMPEWTSSMTRVTRLADGPLGVGSKVRIKQPWLPAAVWRVVELTPRRSFSWVTTRGGVSTLAGHALAARGDGTAVTFTVEQRGLLAPVAGLLTSALTRRYVATELEGLTSRCASAGVRCGS